MIPPRSRTTTKLLLGPLSVARGQKRPSVLPEKKWPSRRSHGLNRTDWKVIFLQSNLVTIDQTTLIWLITADYYDVNTRHSGKVLNDPNLYRVHFDNGHELTKSGGKLNWRLNQACIKVKYCIFGESSLFKKGR